MPKITPPPLEGWQVKEDEHGFAIYTHPRWGGCLRMNLIDGTVELFHDRGPVGSDPTLRAEMVETYIGFLGCDGTEPLERVHLAVSIMYREVEDEPDHVLKDTTTNEEYAWFYFDSESESIRVIFLKKVAGDLIFEFNEYCKTMGANIVSNQETTDRWIIELHKPGNFACVPFDFPKSFEGWVVAHTKQPA